ncbi:Signal recognition particle 14 kDa protein [Sciurus carolinensis]|uniref:Signal recognition particle 14 kDa protein n=1 Tax=Sciurus carolinensis TaxID=30640 RepID=A0AA41MRE8_SCICA|nr:Signal recognition particle 14 kDa protein [Sciurus carolinensis]
MVLLESEQVQPGLAGPGADAGSGFSSRLLSCLAGGTGTYLTRRCEDLRLPNGVGLLTFQFLTELTRLFQKCRLSGSVYITLKKYDGRTKPAPRKGSVEGVEPSDNKCLLRATDGKKKISTVVSWILDGTFWSL